LSNAEVLLQIINDILDFSRLEAGKMPLEILDFDLGGMLHEVTGLLADRAEAKGIALTAKSIRRCRCGGAAIRRGCGKWWSTWSATASSSPSTARCA
jgi:signal transduction histidine kinase